MPLTVNVRFSPDQWSVYQDYITSVFHTIDSGCKSEDDADSSVEAARAFLEAQKSDHPKLRGPRLAAIELLCRLLARRDQGATQSKIVIFHIFEIPE